MMETEYYRRWGMMPPKQELYPPGSRIVVENMIAEMEDGRMINLHNHLGTIIKWDVVAIPVYGIFRVPYDNMIFVVDEKDWMTNG